ncbi:hypothetical protein [Neobacillus sp. GCM10023253]|uniref:hypothetical protein n=1 Tax=Neobacillus sp. GCM10023253 TaxID=3252644 RepID=UPI00366F9E65
MSINYAEIILNGILEGVIPLLKVFLAPIILWVLIPGIVTQVIFKSRQAYPIGAFVGLIALFTFGPFGSN